jgi:hypothetical protein
MHIGEQGWQTLGIEAEMNCPFGQVVLQVSAPMYLK